jgi:hypothetical protein
MAQATLLDQQYNQPGQQQQQNIDLAEPIPVNQSQLLYSQPLNATVQR